MFSLRKPRPDEVQAFLDAQAGLPFTFPAAGATANGSPPPGFTVDHTRVALGDGEHVYAAAQAALRRWDHFRLGWVETWPPDVRLCQGQVVTVVARIGGLWWLNACRIVYVVDEAGPVRRFGFAYGTLPGHAECGEERFLIEWDPAAGGVWYDILAFSRPRHALARLGYPLTRRLQKAFARASAAAMQRAVAATPSRAV